MKGRRWAWGSVWVVMAVMGCSADHHAEQGRVALDAHDLAAAEQAYRKALDREPSHAEALAGLGWTYHLAGQRGAARSGRAWVHPLLSRHPESFAPGLGR